jgi:hypothetical protein
MSSNEPIPTLDLEPHRARWAAVAKQHGWYTEPFFVQVFVDPDSKNIYDSVSFIGMTEDNIVFESEEWGDY